jgi:hypothetical protein
MCVPMQTGNLEKPEADHYIRVLGELSGWPPFDKFNDKGFSGRDD